MSPGGGLSKADCRDRQKAPVDVHRLENSSETSSDHDAFCYLKSSESGALSGYAAMQPRADAALCADAEQKNDALGIMFSAWVAF